MQTVENITLTQELINLNQEIKLPSKVVSSRILNKKITSQRRKNMLVKVIEFNITNNHLSQDKKSYLKQLFTEAKYYYNYLLNLSQKSCTDDYGNLIYTNPISSIDTKNNYIEVFNSATLEFMPYEIKLLSSQVKQKIKDKISDSIKSLVKRKAKGFKVGKLRFKSEVNIPLKQFNNTYYLDDDFKYLSIQGSHLKFKLNPNKAIKKLSKELGFNQLSVQSLLENKIIEIANAEINKGLNKSKINSHYKLSLTIYINPEIYQEDKILIIKHNIKNYLADKNNINLINTNDNKVKTRFSKNRIKEINQNNINEINKKTNNKTNLNIKEIKQTKINQLNQKKININQSQEFNQITSFKFNLTPEQRHIISLTGIGIDAGIGDEFTFNCGDLYKNFSLNSRHNKFLLATLAKIKIAQKELSLFNNKIKKLNQIKEINKDLSEQKSNYSRKYQKLKNKLTKLWTKYDNIKANMIHHLIGFLSQFKEVNFQHEMIKAWHQNKLKGYSKKVQSGILGKVYAKLKLLNIAQPEKYRMLTTSSKTTQDCVICNQANRLKLSDRVYKYSCGYENNHKNIYKLYHLILVY